MILPTQSKQAKPQLRRCHRRNHVSVSKGFALVATILLMVLLSILVLGMLSLSTVSLRSSSQSDANAEARANARMALMMALDRLQSELGPDQRISANGSILSTGSVSHPQWTGVWDSWKAEAIEDATSSPVSAHQTVEGVSSSAAQMAPTYEPNREDYFRSWLVSLDRQDAAQVASALAFSLSGEISPGGQENAVKLVSEGSVDELTDPDTGQSNEVTVPLVSVMAEDGTTKIGRYGWWVGDESQKARIMDDSYSSDSNLTAAEKVYRSQAPGSTGTQLVEGLENITDDSQLDGLPTLASLNLVAANREDDDPTKPADGFHSITPYSFGVLADVREGGLKRDLSTILEQPISSDDEGIEHMLYEFDDPRFPYQSNPNDERRANSRVPIQDLAAYYQLYDHEPTFANGRRGGVQYTSSALPNSLQIKVPDLDGGSKDRQYLIREYTSLYRRPVVTKVQFLVGVTAQPITQAERDWVTDVVEGTVSWRDNNDDTRYGWGDNMKYLRDTDTLKLKLGVQPMVTLWNPNNLPLVMEANQILRYNVPPFGIRIRKYRAAGDDYESLWMNLGYANNPGGGTSNGQAGGNLLDLKLANDTIVFEPGEVKVFSIPNTAAAYLTDDGDNESNTLDYGRQNMDVVNEWDPFGVFLMKNSAPVGHYAVETPDVYCFDNNGQRAQTLVLSRSDSISISIDSESATTALNRAEGRNASRDAEIRGAGFGLYIFDEGYKSGHWSTWADSLRHEIMISRHGSQSNENRAALGGFYRELMVPGFPGGEAPIEFDNETNAIAGTQLEIAGDTGEIIAVMDFSLSIGCESSGGAAGGFGGGRRITSRPFLHSATGAMPFISQADKPSLYDYGLDWQISKINAVEDSILQAKPGTGNGYYGGGYTVERGTTHVVQSEIPALPPISIASLSHAHLGGFSLAKAIPVGENPDADTYWFKSSEVVNPTGVAFQRVTASGQNGLAPHVVQAIGNSYAHPNIPAEKAFVRKNRTFDLDEGSFDIPFVDHSYLANKALWDEYFFSSIIPQPSKVELFGSTDRTAKEVADDFFQLDGSAESEPLPNPRMQAYKGGLDQAGLDSLFGEAGLFKNGLADKIAAHLMVEGSFNINSTSVEAWKIFLSGLKGKPVAYIESGTSPSEAATDGTAVRPGMLPNAEPVGSSAISAPNAPPEQWKAGRELTDDEIGQLAEAIVYQVKRRGPFLSLSEFVNRRLDGDSPYLASKGALQAALDFDPDVLTERFSETPPSGLGEVTINENFRSSARTLDSEVSGISFDFKEAAEGPIAYGSFAYVDQADILRGLASQMTPRGDTFVIRAYGDSLDADGNVVARAWCEAVVQRIPAYVDPTNEAYEKPGDLSAANEMFGRQFEIQSFRWLAPEEV